MSRDKPVSTSTRFDMGDWHFRCDTFYEDQATRPVPVVKAVAQWQKDDWKPVRASRVALPKRPPISNNHLETQIAIVLMLLVVVIGIILMIALGIFHLP